MKKGGSLFFILSALALVSCSNPFSSSTNPVEASVIVMMGQSNMEGWTHSEYLSNCFTSKEIRTFIDGFENVCISYKGAFSDNTSDGAFSKVKLGEGLNTSLFGPEIGIARKYTTLNRSKKLFLTKYAAGGTSLSSDWASPSKQEGSRLYGPSIDYVKKSLNTLSSNGYKPVIVSFLWAQGENDALTLDEANAYKENEKAYIKDVRASLKDYYATSLPFIDAGVSSSPTWVYGETVNKAKEENASELEDVIYFPTTTEGFHYDEEPTDDPDIHHFDSESEVKLGETFMEKAEPYLL